MKTTITLEFDDTPEDRTRALDTLRGEDWKCLIWEFDQWLRSEIKHPTVNSTAPGGEARLETFELVRSQLHDRLAEEGLKLD